MHPLPPYVFMAWHLGKVETAVPTEAWESVSSMPVTAMPSIGFC
jgi:hypothetical protein